MSSPEAQSYSRAVPSAEALAKCDPDALNATCSTSSVWPRFMLMHEPLRVSQIRAVVSILPERT
jgi:hypothetical protein